MICSGFLPDKNLLRPEFCLVTCGPDQRGCSRSVVQLRLIFDKEEEFSGPGILRNPTGGLRIIIVSPWLPGNIQFEGLVRDLKGSLGFRRV